jgi:hypothetical protein
LAFWFGGTAGKFFLKKRWWFCSFVSIPAVKFWLQIPLFFRFFPPRETPDTCSSETRFNAEASGGERPPTTVYQVREEKENPSLERARPPALLCRESLGGARGETYIPLCSGITC